MGKNKGRNSRSGIEHKVSSDHGEGKVTKSEVNPSESDTSAVDYQERIRKLEEEVSNLHQQLHKCRTTCLCHGERKNKGESNQMELDEHTSQNAGACMKQYESNQYMNTGKTRSEQRTKFEPNMANSYEMEVDYSHDSHKTGAYKKQYGTKMFPGHRKTGKEYQSKQETNITDLNEMKDDVQLMMKADASIIECRSSSQNNWKGNETKKVNQRNIPFTTKMELPHNENEQCLSGAWSMEYQAHKNKKWDNGSQKQPPRNVTMGPKNSDQYNIQEPAENWELFDTESFEHHKAMDEDSSVFQRGANSRRGYDKNITPSHKSGKYFDDNSLRKYYPSNRNARDHNRGAQEQYEGSGRVSEIKGDLFEAPKDFSLAHCVGQDLTMGSGIAVTFRQVFKRLDELYSQRKKVGEVAILEEGSRYIYYLITKKYSTGKPRLSDLEISLHDMKDHIVKNGVKNLAIPRIGCGLDRLNWKEVRKMLEDIFRDVDIRIVVYNFTEDSPKSAPPKIKLRIKEQKMKLVNIEASTLLLMFGTVSCDEDETMKDINSKFPIMLDYKNKDKRMGDIIWLVKGKESLCILIVKESKSHELSYCALMECLKKLLKAFKENQFYYLGFEAIVDNDDDLTTRKIINLFKIVFAHVESELWVCWPPNLQNIYEEFIGVSTQYQYGEHGKGSYRTLPYK